MQSISTSNRFTEFTHAIKHSLNQSRSNDEAKESWLKLAKDFRSRGNQEVADAIERTFDSVEKHIGGKLVIAAQALESGLAKLPDEQRNQVFETMAQIPGFKGVEVSVTELFSDQPSKVPAPFEKPPLNPILTKELLVPQLPGETTLQDWNVHANRFTAKDGTQMSYWRSEPKMVAKPSDAKRGAPNTNLTVLVHGYPSASFDWVDVWRMLDGTSPLLAADMKGFGMSDKSLGGDFSVPAQADRLIELIEKQLKGREPKRVNFVAHDYGDTVVQEILARHVEGKLSFDIDTTVLLNGGLFPETHNPTFLQKLMASPVGDTLEKFMTKGLFKQGLGKVLATNKIDGDFPPRIQRFLDDAAENVFVNGGENLLHELLGYIQERQQNRERWVSAIGKAQSKGVNLQLIDGVKDTISGANMVENFEATFKDIPVRKLDCGHYPQIEMPGEVADSIKELFNIQNARYTHFPEGKGVEKFGG